VGWVAVVAERFPICKFEIHFGLAFSSLHGQRGFDPLFQSRADFAEFRPSVMLSRG